jgi:glycosyltransferase involved in cell wall biosynthesis
LRKPNGGQASAFNFGFAHARGQFIALLDADDVWLPNKLGRIYEAFLRQPDAGMAYHRVYLWTEGQELSTRDHFIPVSGRVVGSRSKLLCYPMMQTSCLVFRRDALQELLPMPEEMRTQADAYLTALIVFVSPVLAVDEYLGKYRLHGGNLFHAGTSNVSVEQLRHRMAMREALVRNVLDWLRKHGVDANSSNIGDYLKQWRKAQEADGFALQTPGHWNYFRHLIEFPLLYRDLMTSRQLAYNYLRSFVALALGYRHLHFFDDLHVRSKELRMRWSKQASTSRPVKNESNDK